MRFLTCEPNINGYKDTDYLDEADRFYLNPNEWFTQNENTLKNISHLVLFENLYDDLNNIKSETVEEFLRKFSNCERIFYSFIEQSKRLGKNLLLCYKNSQLLENYNVNNDY